MSSSVVSVILLADIAVFSVYVTDVLIRFGIPVTLSITYYRYERWHKGFGFLFPALMVFVCGTAIPIWIITSFQSFALGSYLAGIPVVAEICLLAVAFSARYKRKPGLINFHYACAIVAAACAVVWLCLVAWHIPFMWFWVGLLFGFVAAGILTYTLKKCTLFWLELAAFYSIFFTLFFIYSVPFQI